MNINHDSQMRVAEIQAALREHGIDGWLFYDHHYRDPLAYRVLSLPSNIHASRRWYYVIPSSGEPKGLVHRVESSQLDSLPGKKDEYSSWDELHKKLRDLLSGLTTVAMQYSPDNLNFYVGLVDAGTVELVRSFGHEVVGSADLISRFEATWSEEQIESHFAAGRAIDAIMQQTFRYIADRVRRGGTSEFEVQQFIAEAFTREDLLFDNAPVVAINENSADPHYSPTRSLSKSIRPGDLVLLDIWGKKKQPNAVYYDITWTGTVGPPSTFQQEIFSVVTKARDSAFQKVKSAIEDHRTIRGWQVDQVCRTIITEAGYGENFVHRTGHSIGTEVHANGPHIDNFETMDDRELIPNICFSVEPGIYMTDFGVRSEFDVLVRRNTAQITGAVQKDIVII